MLALALLLSILVYSKAETPAIINSGRVLDLDLIAYPLKC